MAERAKVWDKTNQWENKFEVLRAIKQDTLVEMTKWGGLYIL
jgi:hypothetical protein